MSTSKVEEIKGLLRQLLAKVKESNEDPKTTDETRLKLFREVLLPAYRGLLDVADAVAEEKK